MPDGERQTTLLRPRVMRIASSHQNFEMRFAQPGTVALMVAGAEGAEVLERIATAVQGEDLEEVERLFSEAKQAFARTMLLADPAVLAREQERTHAAFVHGRRRIVVGMFTPSGIPIAHSLALLGGDQVDSESFAVVVSRLADTDDEVHALAVARIPELTALERDVLALASTHPGDGVELGFWTEGLVAHLAGEYGERIIDFAADQVGITDQINAAKDFVGHIEHVADDFVGAAYDVADGVIHGLAQAAGIDAVVQAGEDVVRAVVNVADAVDQAFNEVAEAAVNVGVDAAGAIVDAAAGAVGAAADIVGNAVDAGVDAIGDVVGAAIDWVVDNVFGDGSPELQRRFEEAALAQNTFQKAFQRQIDAGTVSMETIKPAASLTELVSLRSQIVRQTAPRKRAISLRRPT